MDLSDTANSKKTRWVIFFAVVIVACVTYLWNLNALPLTDYDEATYAQVTRDTVASSDIVTLKRFDEKWFEKPPLYFWMAIGSTSIFGTEEYAYRIPSVLLAILGIALLWLLVYRLTDDSITASAASFVLLSSAFYFISARQVRLDIPAITSIIGALTAFVYGWGQRRWLLAIAPIIAIGFMFKSFVAFLAIPLIIIFAIVFRKYGWMKDIYFWLGVLIAVAILAPWHWYEYSVWGDVFWNEYFGHHVFERFSAGVAENTSYEPLGYVYHLIRHGQPWIYVFVLFSLYGVWAYVKDKHKNALRLLVSSLIGAVVIFLLFAFSRTKILTYMLPLFPLMAIVIAVGTCDLIIRLKKSWAWYGMGAVYVILFIISFRLASGIVPTTLAEMHRDYDFDEKAIGEVIAKDDREANVYLLEWPFHEVIRFYGGRQITQLQYPPDGTVLKAPWYLMFTNLHVPYFVTSTGIFKEQYRNATLNYKTGKIFLIHGEEDLELEP